MSFSGPIEGVFILLHYIMSLYFLFHIFTYITELILATFNFVTSPFSTKVSFEVRCLERSWFYSSFIQDFNTRNLPFLTHYLKDLLMRMKSYCTCCLLSYCISIELTLLDWLLDTFLCPLVKQKGDQQEIQSLFGCWKPLVIFAALVQMHTTASTLSLGVLRGQRGAWVPCIYKVYLAYRELCHLVQYTCPIVLPLISGL